MAAHDWLRFADTQWLRAPAKGGLDGAAIDRIAAIRTRDQQRRAEEALRESERRFRLLAENSTDIITRHTPEGVFRYVSPASQTLLGYAPGELVGHNAMQYVHPDDLTMVQTFYQQLLAQPHVNISTLTFRGRRKDGQYRWLEITARTIRDADTGQVVEFQVATRDVTERQQAAQALQESERRFRTLIANLPGMVYRCRNDQWWTMEYLSEGCRQLTGYAPDDLLLNAKVSYAELIHPDDAATVWEQVQQELQAHRPFQITYRIITASGALKWVWEQGRAVVNAQGDVQNIEGYITDITQWTEAEIAVKQREATLRAIFEAALNVSFIITDADDRTPHVTEFSPGAEYSFGYTRDELLGQPVNRLHRQEDIAQFPAIHRAMRKGRMGFSGETVLIRKNGDAFPALFSTYPLFDEHGNMYAALGVSIDITEQKHIEEQLRQTGEELDQFFNLAPDLLAIADTDGHFRRLNPSWERTLGYSCEELQAGLFFDFVHPDDLASTHEAVAQLSTQHHVINFVHRFRCKDGSYRWIEWRSAPSGTRIFAAARDITDRLQAEEALRASEQRFRSLFNTMTEGVVVHAIVRNADGIPTNYRILDANPAFARQTGITIKQAINTLATDLYHTDTPPFFDRYLSVVETGRPSVFEIYFPPLAKYFTISAFSPAPDMFATVFEDITARKQDEEALRAAEATLNSILQTVPAGIGILRNREFQWTNEEFCRMIGYTRDELIGHSTRMVYPSDEEFASVETKAYVEMHETGMGEMQLRFRRKDGSILYVLLRIRPRDPERPEEDVVFALIDITGRKRTEEALRESEQRFRMLIERLPLPVAIYSVSGDVEYVNDQFVKVLGYTLVDIPTVEDWWPRAYPDPEYRRKVMAVWTEALTDAERSHTDIAPHEYRVTCKDGTVRTMEILAKNMGNTYLVLWNDVTERRRAEEALRESEERFRTLIEKAPVAIGMARHMLGIYANLAYERMFRLPGPEDAAVPVIERYAPQVRDWISENLHAREAGQPAAMEYDTIGLRADGTEFPMHVAITRVQLPEGETTLAFITDITERKRAEDALRVSEERLRFALEGANEGVWDVNIATHIITYMSPRDKELLGYAPEELQEETLVWDNFMLPEDLPAIRSRLADYLAGHAPLFEMEQRLCTKSGTWKWVLTRGKVVERDADGQPVRMTGTHTDITERKLTEQALQREQLFTNAIFESVPGLLYVYSADGYLVRWNKQHEAITGYSAEELAHKNILDWYQGEPDDIASITSGVEKALREGYAEAEGHLITKNGATRLFAFTAVRMIVEGEVFFVGIGIDITAQRQAEQERERLFEENKAQRILFETIVRDVPAGIALLQGAEHRYTLANPAYLPFVRGKGEIVARTVAEVFPEIATTVVPLLDHVFQTGEPFSASDMPMTLVRDDVPTQAYISFTYTPWRDAHGAIQGVLALAIETTAQMRARQDVEQERTLLRTVLAALPIGIFILDADGRFVHTNDAVHRIWGGKAPSIHSIADYDRYVGWWADTGELIQAEEWAGARAVTRGETVVGEVINIQRFDNTRGTILNSAVPLRNAESEISGAVVVIQDITELKRAEDTINRERAFLASAIELLPFPIFFASTNQAIFRTNQACREFLHEDGLDQWRAITLLDPNTHEPIAAEDRGLTHLFSGEGAPPPREVMMKFPDGKEMPALLYVAPIAVGKESIAAVIAFQDITSLKEADQAKNQFLKVISHELRTPLTSIIGWAKMLQEAPEIMPDAVPIILQSAHQFEGLLERMVILSRILTGKLTARQDTVNLCTLATEVEAEFQPAAARKGVTLTWLPPAESPQTEGDTHLIRLAFTELVDNAINFTPAGGHVTLTCHTTSDDRVTFTVTDTGRGITAEELPNIMKPFSQFRREEAIGGIGIGLTLVQGIAHAHHGEVVATSPGIDQGATVTMVLPMRAEDRSPHEEA